MDQHDPIELPGVRGSLQAVEKEFETTLVEDQVN